MKKLILLSLISLTVVQPLLARQELPELRLPVFKKDTLTILKMGAKGDGNFLNTKAIQASIDAIHAKGGGVVEVPAGLWHTGPIVLKSNVNLYLASGATLLFSADFDQYPLVEANWEGLPQMRNQSPFA